MPLDSPPPAHPAATLAVLGAGAWGAVLATLLAAHGAPVRLWMRDPDTAARVARTRTSLGPTPPLALPESVAPTADLDRALDGVAGVFVAVPVAALPALAERLPPLPGLVSCAKGLVGDELRTPSTVLRAARRDTPVAVLSGPNLAGEIAEGMPAAATVAAADPAWAGTVQGWLQGPRFRVYRDVDPLGMEVAGAYKNVIALAAGMSDALGFGVNARAALITRGLAEMARLVTHLGGRARSAYGLAGVGDLVATCSSERSRNRTAGWRLARGDDVASLRADGLTVEGLPTVSAVHRHAGSFDLELPLAAAVHAVTFEGRSAPAMLEALLQRAAKPEWPA